MATSYNTNVTLYSGVPLVKGDDEVLLLAASAAKGQLAQYQIATYSAYYFERANRRYIQIDDVYGNLDNANYISFENNSHGGKTYFAFVDQIIYINDNNTQIEFTIDPFPTFYGDASMKQDVYIRRAKPKIRTRNMPYYFTEDFQFPSVKYEFQNIGNLVYQASATPVVYFASARVGGQGLIGTSGLKFGDLSASVIEDIQQNGGVIIGAYMIPDAWKVASAPAYEALADFSVGDPFVGITCRNQKIKTGVYTRLAVTGTGETKYYNIEEFDNPESIVFGCTKLMVPSPAVFIYPKNYKKVPNNLAEGIFAKFPALPITANATYTTQQRYAELAAAGAGLIGGAVAGANYGPIGSVIGGAVGALTPMIKGAYDEFVGTSFKPPTVIGHGEPVVDAGGNIRFNFNTIQPSDRSVIMIDDYLDRYGWAIDGVFSMSRVYYDQDKSFLQTGEALLYGTPADAELNARIMNGIYIRTQLP